jgi:hypothetical protein
MTLPVRTCLPGPWTPAIRKDGRLPDITDGHVVNPAVVNPTVVDADRPEKISRAALGKSRPSDAVVLSALSRSGETASFLITFPSPMGNLSSASQISHPRNERRLRAADIDDRWAAGRGIPLCVSSPAAKTLSVGEIVIFEVDERPSRSTRRRQPGPCSSSCRPPAVTGVTPVPPGVRIHAATFNHASKNNVDDAIGARRDCPPPRACQTRESRLNPVDLPQWSCIHQVPVTATQQKIEVHRIRAGCWLKVELSQRVERGLTRIDRCPVTIAEDWSFPSTATRQRAASSTAIAGFGCVRRQRAAVTAAGHTASAATVRWVFDGPPAASH